MLVERNVPLQAHNTFGISAKALQLVRVQSESDIGALLADPQLRDTQKFVLGGGSNIVLTGDLKALVLKVELKGMRLVEESEKAWVVEAAAGEDWHDFVQWTLDNSWPGLENMALIPGSVGASPVQNIGAYGVELQDRFDALDAIDLATGNTFTLDAAQCAFGYRDSIFKHGPGQTVGASRSMGLAGRALITRVRFRLAKAWKPVLGYLDLEKRWLRRVYANLPHSKFLNGSAPSGAPNCQIQPSLEMRGVFQKSDRHTRAVCRHHCKRS